MPKIASNAIWTETSVDKGVTWTSFISHVLVGVALQLGCSMGKLALTAVGAAASLIVVPAERAFDFGVVGCSFDFVL
jgi:hypothetical protein